MICDKKGPHHDSPPPRFRARKSRNGAKKQPQRGLGVAQLERLRLEEQGKQQEAAAAAAAAAACAASLHHRRLFPSHLSSDDGSLLQLAEQEQRRKQQQRSIAPFRVSHYCHSLRTGGGGDDGRALGAAVGHSCGGVNCSTALCRMMICARDMPPFPILPGFVLGEPPPGRANPPCSKPNHGNADDSFMEIPGMAATDMGRTLSLEMGIAGSGKDETETSLCSLSQSHNLRSPRSRICRRSRSANSPVRSFLPIPTAASSSCVASQKFKLPNVLPSPPQMARSTKFIKLGQCNSRMMREGNRRFLVATQKNPLSSPS